MKNVRFFVIFIANTKGRHALLGFVIVSFNNNRISLIDYKRMLLEIFDTQHMNFSIKDVNLFFENDEVTYTKVNKFFVECEQKAKEFICDFERKYGKHCFIII